MEKTGKKHEFTCTVCKEEKVYFSNVSTGYATNDKGDKICYDCCGVLDRKSLEDLKPKQKLHGFYLLCRTNDSGSKLCYLENWCGTFSQLVYVWETYNNWGYPVYHFENNGGKVPFYGRLTGDSKQAVDFVQRKVGGC